MDLWRINAVVETPNTKNAHLLLCVWESHARMFVMVLTFYAGQQMVFNEQLLYTHGWNQEGILQTNGTEKLFTFTYQSKENILPI